MAKKLVDKARFAGWLYLASVVCVGVPLLYVNALIVDNDAALTAKNFLTSQTAFRVCVCSELIGAIVLIFVAKLLCRVFGKVDEGMSSLLMSLVAVSVPLSFMTSMANIAALELFLGPSFLSVFSQPERQAAALFLLDTHVTGVNIANAFRGLWLFPLGVLILQSRLLPRFIGAWLIVSGAAVVLVGGITILAPDCFELAFRMAIIPQFGQIAAIVWLIVKGVQNHPVEGPG